MKTFLTSVAGGLLSSSCRTVVFTMCYPGFQRHSLMCCRMRAEQHSKLKMTCQCPSKITNRTNTATLCFVILISIAVCNCSDDSSEVNIK